ncbi:Beta-cubebene synthase [Cinnamomum micranthum f. kanehirae]|uniref:Beta-cubebene synthase n=1 Tax=Cinnamomum micranthum f. kanehirae TaxID=337451 RepID=A0A3S3Q0T8_9MAGN|nr:Beta-cubebene synthase [Cinnamomum micranthum f. kanehirae]
MKVLIQTYLEQAQWCNNGYVPTLEEHLKVSLPSCGYICVTVASFVGMGEEVTKEAFDWIKTHPKFLMDSSLIGRLVNDIQSNELEQKRTHVASTIESYMKEHGVSWPVASEKIREMVASAWKDMNKFCLKPTLFPLSLLTRVVNLTRFIEVIYLHGDGYTDSSSEIKEMIKSMFVDPIPF